MMLQNGSVTSGICSTPSRAYENSPSTTIPTMTMVANTGFLIETRVIHMVFPLSLSLSLSLPFFAWNRGASARRRALRRGRFPNQRRRADLEIVERGGQDPGTCRERGLHLDASGRVIASADRDDPARELAVLDGPDKVLTRLDVDRDGGQRGHRRPRGQ